MKTLSISFALTLTFTTGYARSDDVNEMPKSASDFQAFIPTGYEPLSTATGDLNGDSEEDVALVLRHQKEKVYEMGKEPPRQLVILFKKSDRYYLAATAGRAILCAHCGGVLGDPFDNISIANNELAVEHYGGSSWRWSYTHTFKFLKDSFYLVGSTKMQSNANNYCDRLGENAGLDFQSSNLLTGESVHKRVSDSGCLLLKDRKKKFSLRPLQEMSRFKFSATFAGKSIKMGNPHRGAGSAD